MVKILIMTIQVNFVLPFTSFFTIAFLRAALFFLTAWLFWIRLALTSLQPFLGTFVLISQIFSPKLFKAALFFHSLAVFVWMFIYIVMTKESINNLSLVNMPFFSNTETITGQNYVPGYNYKFTVNIISLVSTLHIISYNCLFVHL